LKAIVISIRSRGRGLQLGQRHREVAVLAIRLAGGDQDTHPQVHVAAVHRQLFRLPDQLVRLRQLVQVEHDITLVQQAAGEDRVVGMLLAEQDQLVAQLVGQLEVAEIIVGLAGQVEEGGLLGQRRGAAFLLQLRQHRQGAQRRETGHVLDRGQALGKRQGSIGKGQAGRQRKRRQQHAAASVMRCAV
jgi:hypothetical protein